MQYHIRTEGGERAASTDLVDNFAAEMWAMDWLHASAKERAYVLERADGGFAMTLFQTDAGQWYRSPRVSSAA